MKKIKINHSIEYLCPTLILSYFFIHNISLVLLGIFLSLYLININYIYIIIKSINKKLMIKKRTNGLNETDKVNKPYSLNIKSTKMNERLTLAEEVEELGFIPSINENDESTAA
jgi:hypothetical protein